MLRKLLLPLRRLHGRIDDFIRSKTVIPRGYIKSLLLSKKQKDNSEEYPVDFVILWVDGNDPEWLAEKDKYQNNNYIIKRDNTVARFRDWNFLQYWFRSVEKHAPWVRYVYFVTWGHTPKWLNKDNPKLKIINHKDFIPQQYLPTFSTIPIELNLWRIEGLSEHFVYFNDDMFLNTSVSKNQFFCKGFPKYCAIAKPDYPHIKMDAWEHQQFNVAGVINSIFNIKRSIINNPEKWFSYKYGKNIKHNVRLYEDGLLLGMTYSHLGIPCRVSVMKEVWNTVGEKLDLTCRNKFRTMGDLIFMLFEEWEILKGSFEPVESDYYGYAANITPDNFELFEKMILREEKMMICTNDSDQLKEEYFEEVRDKLITVFNKKYPEKSSFEL